MDDTRLSADRGADRWMLLAGPLFTLLAIAAAVLAGSTPGEKESVDGLVRHFTDKEGRVIASIFLAAPSAAALLVFVSRLRAGVDDRARAPRALLVAGGTVYAVGILLGASVLLALTVAANEGYEDAVRPLNVLNAALWIPLVAGIGTMLLGAGLAVLRTGLLPRWLGWVAVVVGVLSLLGPGGFLGAVVAPFWIGAAGLLLYSRRSTDTTDAPGVLPGG